VRTRKVYKAILYFFVMEKNISIILTMFLILVMILGFVSARYVVPSKDIEVQKTVIPFKDEVSVNKTVEIEKPSEEEKNISDWIYQEDAEGVIVRGEWYFGESNLYDGDWSSYDFESMAKSSYLELIYTKAPGAIGAVWKVKDGDGTTNLTIPDSCFNSDSEELLFRVQSGGDNGEMLVSWSCYNDGSWMQLRFTRRTRSIYEEGIYWELDKILEESVNFIPPIEGDNSVKQAGFIHLNLESSFEKVSKWVYNLYKDGGLYRSYDSSVINQAIPRIEDNSMISAGSDYTCFLKQDGSVKCQGSANINGQANDYSGNDVIQVSAGAAYTCFLKQDGSVKCQGANDYGQANDYSGNDVVQVATGMLHACFLKQDGSVQCQGKNMNHDADDYAGNDVVQVSAGRYHTCFLKQDGSVQCQGHDSFGSIGQDRDYTGHDVVQVSAGGDHTCFLKQDGSVQCQGDNYNGKSENYHGNDVVQVATGLLGTCFLKQDGSVQCQGYNSYGELDAYTGDDVIQVTMGNYHTCFLKQDGSVHSQGANYYGQAENYVGNDIKTTPYYYFLGLEDGDYSIIATVCDDVGECSSTETRAISIISGPPIVQEEDLTKTYPRSSTKVKKIPKIGRKVEEIQLMPQEFLQEKIIYLNFFDNFEDGIIFLN